MADMNVIVNCECMIEKIGREGRKTIQPGREYISKGTWRFLNYASEVYQNRYLGM